MMKMVLSLISISMFSVAAQANPLKCYTSTERGELETPENEMGPQPGFEHLKDQNFYKKVTLSNGTDVEVTLQLRSKAGSTFDFRVFAADMSQLIHVVANLDDSGMFQYSDGGKSIAVMCTKE